MRIVKEILNDEGRVIFSLHRDEEYSSFILSGNDIIKKSDWESIKSIIHEYPACNRFVFNFPDVKEDQPLRMAVDIQNQIQRLAIVIHPSLHNKYIGRLFWKLCKDVDSNKAYLSALSYVIPGSSDIIEDEENILIQNQQNLLLPANDVELIF